MTSKNPDIVHNIRVFLCYDYFMDIRIAILFLLSVVAAIDFSIAVFVLLKNPKNIVNRIFFIFVLGIAIWVLGIALLSYTKLFIFDKVVFFGGTLMVLGLVLFAKVFPNGESPGKRFWLSLIPFLGIFISIPFNVFIKELILTDDERLIPVNGPGLPFYAFFIALYIGLSLFLLVQKYSKSSGIVRLQIKYLFAGAAIFITSAFLFDVYLPFFNIFQFNLLGPASSVILVGFTAYAIVKHHLMDISVIIRLGTVYALLFAIIAFLYTYIAGLVGEYASGPLTYIIPSILITFGFLPLKSLIETLTDKIFFRKTYSVQAIINQLNNIIHKSGLNLNELLEKFNQIIAEFIRVEHAAILLLTPQGEFISRRNLIDTDKKLVLGRNHLIVEHIHKYPDKLIGKERMGDSMHQAIVEELNRLHTSLVIPIEVKGQVIGLYFVGAKKSQDPFTDEEIDLLRLIAAESGSSIDNARLFEELKKIDEVKSKFISIISHQLRTPLTSIRWNLELLLQESFDPKTKNELFEHSYQGALNMAKNLGELFTALDIEEKGIITRIKVEQANFHELLKEAMKEIDHEAKEKNLNLDISFPDELPVLALDKERVSRILAILLKNAVAYSNPGHEVNVVGMIEIKNNAKYFVCSVRDQGIGLTPDDERGIFTRFYRGEEAKKHSPNGSGLGLFVAKYLVNLHHGEIWYTSHGPNKGTTFSFSLPIV